MDEIQIRGWFDEYLRTFAALGRGESGDLRVLNEFYGLPLLLSSDEAFAALTSTEEIMGFARQQVEGMRAASYHHTETTHAELTIPNATSALYQADFVRRRADGSAIGRLVVTYLIATGPEGPRISTMLVHTPRP